VTDDEPFFDPDSYVALLLRERAALRAERDALKARVADLERSQCRQCAMCRRALSSLPSEDSHD
jgi:hypothetical protein